MTSAASNGSPRFWLRCALCGQPAESPTSTSCGACGGMLTVDYDAGPMVDPARRPRTMARGILRSVPTVRPEEPLAAVMETFFRTGLEVLPVVDADGHQIGVVSERAVVGALERTLATGTPPPAPQRTLT